MICNILRRKCLLKQSIEGTIGGIEVAGRRGKRRKQLLNDLEEKRGYCKLKQETQRRTFWRTRFKTGSDHIVRQTRMNESNVSVKVAGSQDLTLTGNTNPPRNSNTIC